MHSPMAAHTAHMVVLLAEDVDRNALNNLQSGINSIVVLLAEDVDRNKAVGRVDEGEMVVLLAEDVDRNYGTGRSSPTVTAVVLLAEDVDRNLSGRGKNAKEIGRPPRGGCG